jgi:hypothetical protein
VIGSFLIVAAWWIGVCSALAVLILACAGWAEHRRARRRAARRPGPLPPETFEQIIDREWPGYWKARR